MSSHQQSGALTYTHSIPPWPASVWTPEEKLNNLPIGKVLLVARSPEGSNSLHKGMCRKPVTQGQQLSHLSCAKPYLSHARSTPFETIALDFITKLAESQGFNSILTVTDHNCTKMTHFIPCREEINAEKTVALYAKHIFPSYGLSSKIISDRDPCFISCFIRELCNILGSQSRLING